MDHLRPRPLLALFVRCLAMIDLGLALGDAVGLGWRVTQGVMPMTEAVPGQAAALAALIGVLLILTLTASRVAAALLPGDGEPPIAALACLAAGAWLSIEGLMGAQHRAVWIWSFGPGVPVASRVQASSVLLADLVHVVLGLVLVFIGSMVAKRRSSPALAAADAPSGPASAVMAGPIPTAGGSLIFGGLVLLALGIIIGLLLRLQTVTGASASPAIAAAEAAASVPLSSTAAVGPQERAYQGFLAGAQLGDARAMRAVGDSLAAGRGVAADHAQAAMWLSRAAATGDIDAMIHLGDLRSREHSPGSDAEARAIYIAVAAKGSAGGMSRLADFMMDGRGGAVDRQGAQRWYEKGAALGDDLCQTKLIALDPRRAGSYVEALKAKAGHGDPWAMLKLGDAYAQAQFGLPADAAQALDWYQKVTATGNLEGWVRAGDLYRRGILRPDAVAQALPLYEQAALAGWLPAMDRLCDAYGRGMGASPDAALAQKWCGKAAELRGTAR